MNVIEIRSDGTTYANTTGSFGISSSENLDLFGALHNVSYIMGAHKDNGWWKIYSVVQDTYDFAYNNYEGSLVGDSADALNNYAYLAQTRGIINEYDIDIFDNATYSCYCN